MFLIGQAAAKQHPEKVMGDVQRAWDRASKKERKLRWRIHNARVREVAVLVSPLPSIITSPKVPYLGYFSEALFEKEMKELKEAKNRAMTQEMFEKEMKEAMAVMATLH